MIIAIIGILAAIALPAYQDYISKSQTTRVVGELAAAKTAVDAGLFEGKTPVLGSTNSGASVSPVGLSTSQETTAATASQTRSNLMGSIALNGFNPTTPSSGNITATLGRNANADIAGATIAQIRDTNGVWTCEVKPGTAKGFKQKFTPTGCEYKAS